VHILFATPDLEALCATEKLQKKALGAACSKKLKTRLADILAAGRVTDLVAGRPHPLGRERQGEFAVDLDGGRRLVFAPGHSVVPKRPDGSIAWESVTIVRIVFIGDYHD
jgi:proteic killer suppression protein